MTAPEERAELLVQTRMTRPFTPCCAMPLGWQWTAIPILAPAVRCPSGGDELRFPFASLSSSSLPRLLLYGAPWVATDCVLPPSSLAVRCPSGGNGLLHSVTQIAFSLLEYEGYWNVAYYSVFTFPLDLHPTFGVL